MLPLAVNRFLKNKLRFPIQEIKENAEGPFLAPLDLWGGEDG